MCVNHGYSARNLYSSCRVSENRGHWQGAGLSRTHCWRAIQVHFGLEVGKIQGHTGRMHPRTAVAAEFMRPTLVSSCVEHGECGAVVVWGVYNVCGDRYGSIPRRERWD
jgi:hypothetical protein